MYNSYTSSELCNNSFQFTNPKIDFCFFITQRCLRIPRLLQIEHLNHDIKYRVCCGILLIVVVAGTDSVGCRKFFSNCWDGLKPQKLLNMSSSRNWDQNIWYRLFLGLSVLILERDKFLGQKNEK